MVPLGAAGGGLTGGLIGGLNDDRGGATQPLVILGGGVAAGPAVSTLPGSGTFDTAVAVSATGGAAVSGGGGACGAAAVAIAG